MYGKKARIISYFLFIFGVGQIHIAARVYLILQHGQNSCCFDNEKGIKNTSTAKKTLNNFKYIT